MAERADPAVSGPDADPDADGIPNIVEAAIGSSPKFHTPYGLTLSLVSTSVSGSGRTTILQTHRAETSVQNLKLEIQASDSLSGDHWSTLAEKSGDANWLSVSADIAQPEEMPVINGSVPLRVEEFTALPVYGRRFYRMMVSVIPNP